VPARRFAAGCESFGRYCLIGTLAVNCYVEPVYTLDADFVVDSSNLRELSRSAPAPASQLRIQLTTDPRYQRSWRGPWRPRSWA